MYGSFTCRRLSWISNAPGWLCLSSLRLQCILIHLARLCCCLLLLLYFAAPWFPALEALSLHLMLTFPLLISTIIMLLRI